MTGPGPASAGADDAAARPRGRSPRRSRVRRVLTLALPAVVSELANQLMALVDTWMVAPLGPRALAAVAAGSSLYFPIVLMFLGFLLALDTLISQAHGAGEDERAGHYMSQGLWLSLAFGLPLTWAFCHGEPILLALGQPPAVAAMGADYLAALALGVIPFLAYVAVRGFCHGLGDTRSAMVVTLVANLVNVAANHALLTGNWGAPALGVAGLGYATAISRTFMLAGLVWAARRPRLAAGRARWDSPDLATLREVLALGIPIGLLLVLEAGGFGAAGLLVGWLGELPLAAHQVVLTGCTTTFMVPLGLATAAALVVGQGLGRGQPDEAWADGRVCLGLGVAFMACSGAVMASFPEGLARLFTDHPGTVAAAAALFPYGAAFQIVDAMQCVSSGCLRGAGDTRTTLVCNLLGFWICGLPLGYLLAFRMGWGAPGVWAGLITALTVTGTTLSVRFLAGWWMPPEAPASR